MEVLQMASIYERLFDLKPCIVSSYPYGSKQGGARLHPEVVEAMSEAANYTVDMFELLDRAGQKIADMLGVEAAFITSGACAGLALASAAVMTRSDVRLMEQIPNTEYPIKMKNELIMQMGHITHYIGCLKSSGAKIVEVGGGYLPRGNMGGATWQEFNESWYKGMDEGWLFHPMIYDEAKKKFIRIFKVLPGHIENAINERTAALVYVRSGMCVRGEYEVSLEETAKIAKKHNLPVIVDYAADAFKKAYFKRPFEEGADLAIFSGGKDIEGPNDTGIVLGRKDLIEAVRNNSSPHYRIIIGRGYKVSREQIVGLVVALQRKLAMDEEAEHKKDVARCDYIVGQFKSFPHVQASTYVPDDEIEGIIGYGFPAVHLKIDEDALGVTVADVGNNMTHGIPQIYLSYYLAPWKIVEIIPKAMKDEDVDYVVDRIKDALSKNLKNKGK